MARTIFQLRITLDGVDPPVWRRVAGARRVHPRPGAPRRPARDGLVGLPPALFDIDGVQYGEPDPDGLLDVRDELDTRLDAVARQGERFRYTYDFGDWWEHDVTSRTCCRPTRTSATRCALDGERACPPEDVGGLDGYATSCRARRPRASRARGDAGLARPRLRRRGLRPGRATTLRAA